MKNRPAERAFHKFRALLLQRYGFEVGEKLASEVLAADTCNDDGNRVAWWHPDDETMKVVYLVRSNGALVRSTAR